MGSCLQTKDFYPRCAAAAAVTFHKILDRARTPFIPIKALFSLKNREGSVIAIQVSLLIVGIFVNRPPFLYLVKLPFIRKGGFLY